MERTAIIDLPLGYEGVLSNILDANFPGIQLLYADDISKGFQGWRYQHDSTGRTGLTLSNEARHGDFSLLAHTRKVANDEAWMRKGIRLPSGLSKIVFGCHWMGKSITANNPEGFKFELDTQGVSDDASNGRFFFSARYLNYSGGLLQKWQLNTGTSATYSDVPGGGEYFCYNESGKPMDNYMVLSIDYANKTYDKLFSNGNEYDVSAIAPSKGTFLTGFEKGAVNIYVVENRSDSTEEGMIFVEKPFLGFVFA